MEVTLSATLLKKSTKPLNNNIYFDEEDRVSPEPEQHYNNVCYNNTCKMKKLLTLQGTGSGAFHNGTGGGGKCCSTIFYDPKIEHTYTI